jgi:long-chain acyl-CoA synthetase
LCARADDGFSRHSYLPRVNLAANLTASAEVAGEKTALKLDDLEVSYRALDVASARVAGLLRERGIAPGERVAVMLPNTPEFAVVYYGALRAGAVVVPMNVLLKRREVAFYLSDSGARMLFAWHGFAEEAEAGARGTGASCLFVVPGEFARLISAALPAEEVADRAADDTAVILYTSGTTGTPKGAELTHSNLSSNVATVVRLHSFSQDDVFLGALPLFHSFGQTCSMNAAIAAGATLSLIPRFDAGRALDIIERDRATVFQGVPTMYSALLHHPGRATADVSTLRVCVSGGASLPAEVLRGFEEAFGCTLLEGYGLSETSPVASSNRMERERRPGSVGMPIEGVSMRIVDADGTEAPAGARGEIVIRGPNVMKGYWGRPDATAEAIRDGWFHTGDVGVRDDDGYFYVVDRLKEMIIRGGYNVYPREVEEVLYEHPAVREVAVLGVPHPELGEEVAAAVALRDGAAVDEESLREFVKARVAAYKYPRRISFFDELPKGPSGKIVKREISLPAVEAAGRS